MLWFEVILSLLISTVQFNGIIAVEKDNDLKISCVTYENATEFTSIHFKYDPRMLNHEYKFIENELEKIKEMIGNREKIVFYFMGFGSYLRSFSDRNFVVAKEEMLTTNACSCTVSHAFHRGWDKLKFLQYFELESVLPKIVQMGSNFIKNIVDSDEFKIKLSTVYLSGFSLGGHIAGMIGRALKGIYHGEMAAAVWAFDPPRIGFPFPNIEGKQRRAQKGDAKFVAVFITSRIGVRQFLGDIDVIVNDGINQPDCAGKRVALWCNHCVGYKIRELIILKSAKLPLNENGIPFAYAYDYSSQCPFDMMNSPLNKSGIYYLRTIKIDVEDKPTPDYSKQIEASGFFNNFINL